VILLDTHVLLWLDRFITATALRHRACLLTADRLILAWPGRLQRTPADT
jgi:PIN domain nuclease of toxin-antitoxin system